MEKILRILIFLTLALAPLYVVRWSYFGVLPMTLLETLIWVSLGVWGVWRIQKRDFAWPKTSLDGPILLLLTAGAVSLFVTPDLRGGLGIFKAYFVEPILFFYVLVDLFRRGVIGKIGVIRGLTLSGFWLSILGIAQTLTGQFIFASHEVGRAHGVFNSGNALALYLGPVIVLGLGNLGGLEFFGGTGGWGIWGIMLTAFVLTKSQGGWVALLVTLGFWLLVKFLSPHVSTKKVVKIFLVSLLTSHFSLLVLIPYFTPKNVINPWERGSSSTLQVRLCLWEGTRNLLLDRPFFGVGLSGFKEVYSQEYFTCDAEPLEYPHNLFLTFWVEMGLVGLIGLIWLLHKLFFQLPAPSFQPPFIYIVIHGLVDVPYFKNDLSLQFWLLAALILVSNLPHSQKAQK